MNPDFSPGMNYQFIKEYWLKDQILAHHFYEHGNYISISRLSTQMGKQPIPSWTFLLLTHYRKSLDKNSSCSRRLTPFEMLCTQKSPQRHLISTMHSLLHIHILMIIKHAKHGKVTYPLSYHKKTGDEYTSIYTKVQ